MPDIWTVNNEKEEKTLRRRTVDFDFSKLSRKDKKEVMAAVVAGDFLICNFASINGSKKRVGISI